MLQDLYHVSRGFTVSTVSGACVFIFSVLCEETLSGDGHVVLSECVDQAQRTPSQKKGAGGVFLPQYKRRQLYDNTTEELHILGLGADLGQGHLGVTLSFCAWISR